MRRRTTKSDLRELLDQIESAQQVLYYVSKDDRLSGAEKGKAVLAHKKTNELRCLLWAELKARLKDE